MYQGMRRLGPKWESGDTEGLEAREAAAAGSLLLPRSAVDFHRLEPPVELR